MNPSTKAIFFRPPRSIDEEYLHQLVFSNPFMTTRKLAKELDCVWWCSSGLVHFELFPADKTVNADLFCRQLTTVREKLRQHSGRTTSHFRLCLLRDNAAPHTTKVTQATLESLGIRVLSFPPYSPDLAPSDFHLFRSLQSFLRDKTLETEDEVKSAHYDFFASKDINIYQRVIHCLVKIWKDVIRHKGKYLIE